MKYFLFFMSLSFFSKAIASEPVPSSEVWNIGEINYVFNVQEKNKPQVSILCNNTLKKCDALLAIEKKKKIKLSESELKGGKNPGSVTCKKYYSGEVLILRNSAGEESSFCKFKDNSLTSTSELY